MIQLGFYIIIIALLAKWGTAILAAVGAGLFPFALIGGGALIVIGLLTGNKALGSGNRGYLP